MALSTRVVAARAAGVRGTTSNTSDSRRPTITETQDDRAKVAELVVRAHDNRSEWTSIAGTAEVVHDRTKASQLWAKPLETWFPDGLDTADWR